jgi:sugar lactone lactonase YvrE
MSWTFEKIAGPYQGGTGGMAWDGGGMLFSTVGEGRILRFDPRAETIAEYRRYTNRVNGIAFSPEGDLYGCQESSCRVIRFRSDGSAATTATQLNGRHHNQPNDLAIDSKSRIWFSDPRGALPASGPQLFIPLDHASVLRLDRDGRGNWSIRRMTCDTAAPRGVLLSADERTLYVAESPLDPAARRELRAYPLLEDDTLGSPTVLHTFGSDHRGAQRGAEGMCRDGAGNILACAGWARSGPGPMIYVFSPAGAVLAAHALPSGTPVKCAFGDDALATLYVTTQEGDLYRVRDTGLSAGA